MHGLLHIFIPISVVKAVVVDGVGVVEISTLAISATITAGLKVGLYIKVVDVGAKE